MKLASITENKGVRQFVLRTVVFAALLLGFYLFVFLFFRHTGFFLKYLTLPQEYYFSFLTGLRKTDFLNAALFTVIIFFLWNRKTIANLKTYKQDFRQTVVFGFLAVFSQVLHYSYKYYVKFNPVPESYSVFLAALKLLFNASFVVFLALAVYNTGILKDQFMKFKRQLPILVFILIGYFFLIQFFQNIWQILGNFVARSLYFMLDLTFNDVYWRAASLTGPRLGVGKFIVGISKECSGVDSLLLFLSLYTGIFALDFKSLDKKRMLLLLVPGVLGTIVYNLLRVYLIMLVGIFISPEFAVDVFHTNVGWITFLVFFIIFWHFGSEWVYVKHERKSTEKSTENREKSTTKGRKNKR